MSETIQEERWLRFPHCVGFNRLKARTAEIERQFSKEIKSGKFKFVSGVICLRRSKEGKLEMLRVYSEKKKFWQPPGGKVGPGEDAVATLHRELREELGVSVPDNVLYMDTYVAKSRVGGVRYAVHAFLIRDCTWEVGDLALGDDVDKAEWTENPLDGQLTTEQTDAHLRELGFRGPKNKNSPPDGYDGHPPSGAKRWFADMLDNILTGM